MKHRVVQFSYLLALGVMVFASYSGYASYEQNRLSALAQMITGDINEPEIAVRFIEHTLLLEEWRSIRKIDSALKGLQRHTLLSFICAIYGKSQSFSISQL